MSTDNLFWSYFSFPLYIPFFTKTEAHVNLAFGRAICPCKKRQLRMLENYKKGNVKIWWEQNVAPRLFYRSYTLLITVNYLAKVDVRVYWSWPVLLDFVTLSGIRKYGIKFHLILEIIQMLKFWKPLKDWNPN